MQLLLITERMWAEQKAGDGVLADQTTQWVTVCWCESRYVSLKRGKEIIVKLWCFHETLGLFSLYFFLSLCTLQPLPWQQQVFIGLCFLTLKRQTMWRGHDTVSEWMMLVLVFKTTSALHPNCWQLVISQTWLLPLLNMLLLGMSYCCPQWLEFVWKQMVHLET